MGIDPVEHAPEPAHRLDRRRRDRARVHWLVRFHRPDSTDLLVTETQDLSSEGFYCRSTTAFAPGQQLNCTLEVPTHGPRTSGSLLRVRCKIRILRVDEPDGDGHYGLACRLEDYRFPPVALTAS